MRSHLPGAALRPAVVALTSVWLLALSAPAQEGPAANPDSPLGAAEMALVKSFEQRRMDAIDQVIGSVIAIYDEDRQGGGSGVIIDPSGIALTNHHVIIGAGIRGWGGLADGELYRWKLIGTDPGGDVALIQMEGRNDFPWTPLGDSDTVRAGDWALAMGNPFILTEDQRPTVTLGIVSGVKRYQSGAGMNQLVYGNCIQVDSSINPGNSGGPLFNFHGQVVGINGRGSFKERGRVNVGLGYAISSNQIKNFLPDLMATKLVEHATLDASFEERDGKVVCSRRNIESPVAEAGLELGDELLEFEGISIQTANQFTNLICTLPADWPVQLKVRKSDGSVKTIFTRALGLPYPKPARPKVDDREKTPEQKRQIQRQLEMVDLLAANPGTIRKRTVNREYTRQMLDHWNQHLSTPTDVDPQPDSLVCLTADVVRGDEKIGEQELWIASDGRFELNWDQGNGRETVRYDGATFTHRRGEDPFETWTPVEAKLSLPIVQALGPLTGVSRQTIPWLGESLIDGSGKADGQAAFRLRRVDADGDKFYSWYQVGHADGLSQLQWAKAAAKRDASDGGVLFLDWQWTDVEGARYWLPRRRRIITGLAESTVMEIVHRSAQRLPVDRVPWLQDPARKVGAGVASFGKGVLEEDCVVLRLVLDEQDRDRAVIYRGPILDPDARFDASDAEAIERQIADYVDAQFKADPARTAVLIKVDGDCKTGMVEQVKRGVLKSERARAGGRRIYVGIEESQDSDREND